MNKDDVLKKWLADDLDANERDAFEKSSDFPLNKAIADNARHFKASHFSEVSNFSNFKNQYNSSKAAPVKRLKKRRAILRIAAVIVISLGVYTFLFSDKRVTVETMASQKTEITLPDASLVRLNAGSQLQFDEKTWNEERQVELNGEAYFKVAKGHVFDVVTPDGIVTVVGTEFNVKQRDHYFEVTCFEGVVRVSALNSEKLLREGDIFKIVDGTSIDEKTLKRTPHWTNNRSSFNAIPLHQILAELERQYDVEVVTENIDTARLFTGGFAHDNLEAALIAISTPMNLDFRMKSSNLIEIHDKNK